MSAVHRWAVVALGVLLIVAVPVGLRVWPTADNDVSASELLARVRAADDPAYSGFVVTQGTLQLPVASRFTDLGALFGEQNRLRVWWRDSDSWRVDRLVASGEEDLIHTAPQTTAYDFDEAEATTSADPDIRLPRTADLLPPVLARRLLSDVDATTVTRLDTRRIAGRTAPGLRLVPASEQSSIDHVDLWADPTSGLTLRVEVYGAARAPALTSAFRSLDNEAPAVERVRFHATDDTEESFDDVLDIADAANQYAPLRPPDTVAGLDRTNGADDGAVGVYGTGLTQLIAIPLRGREAGPLRDQIGITPGSVLSDPGPGSGIMVLVGPLGVLVTGEGDDGGFLLAGTVTADTLTSVADDLLTQSRYLDQRGQRR